MKIHSVVNADQAEELRIADVVVPFLEREKKWSNTYFGRELSFNLARIRAEAQQKICLWKCKW
jgi:hypothetical protein